MAAPSSGVLFTPVVLLSSWGAPTASVSPSPLNATENPNPSPAPVFEALTKACCDHTPALRVKTYAAPELAVPSSGVLFTPVALLYSRGAPTASVFPSLIRRPQRPNHSPSPAFFRFTKACCDHTPA